MEDCVFSGVVDGDVDDELGMSREELAVLRLD